MVQVLVILCFVAVHLHDYMGATPVEPGTRWEVAALAILPLVCLWLFGQVACVRAARAMDRAGSLAAASRAERTLLITRLLAAAHFQVSVLVLGWLDTVRATLGDLLGVDELLCLLPVLVMFALGWWSIHPVERRLREAALWRHLHEGTPIHRPADRWEHVWLSTRHHLLMAVLPLTLITISHEAIAEYAGRVPLPASIDRALAAEGAKFLAALAVFLVTPALLRLLWSTVPITAGPFRDMIRAMGTRHRIRLGEPLLWPTHGTMVNAAVLGVLWPFRYMLFTDALLERLTPREVEAVAAHEVGHVRKRHIIWLGLTVLSVLLVIDLAVSLLATVMGWGNDSSPMSAMVLVTMLVIALAFGLVSRRFEWQADAFAARDLSLTAPREPGQPAPDRITPDAVAAMTSALGSVALISGMRTDRFSFRHGSIRERIQRLDALVGVPLDRLPIDRQVRYIKLGAACVLVLAVTLIILGWLFWQGAEA